VYRMAFMYIVWPVFWWYPHLLLGSTCEVCGIHNNSKLNVSIILVSRLVFHKVYLSYLLRPLHFEISKMFGAEEMKGCVTLFINTLRIFVFSFMLMYHIASSTTLPCFSVVRQKDCLKMNLD